MVNFATIITFFFVFISSFYFNYTKHNSQDGFVVFHTIIDGILTFIILHFLFLQGYVPNVYIVFILIFTLLGIGFIRFINEDEFNKYDEILETTKNNVVLYLKTIGLFFVLMTILRFNPGPLQVVLSVTITLLLNYMYRFVKDPLNNFFQRIKLEFSVASFGTGAIIWIVLGVIVGQFILLNYPYEAFKNSINLNDNIGYFNYIDYSPTVINNHKNKLGKGLPVELDQFEAENITHFYIDGNNLYLYIGGSYLTDQIVIVDQTSGNIIMSETYNNTLVSNTSTKFEALGNQVFYAVDDGIIMFGHTGIFKIENETISRLQTTDESIHQNAFSIDDDLYYYTQVGPADYELYQYNNGSFILDSTIRTSNFSQPIYETLTVISDTLFIMRSDTLTLYEDNTISFENIGSYQSYSKDNNILYTINYGSLQNKTIFTVQTSNQMFSKTYMGQYNRIPITTNDVTFLLSTDESQEHISIINENAKHISYIDLYERKPFIPSNIINKTTYANMIPSEAGLTYLQVGYRNQTILTLGTITETSIEIPLELYSHLSFVHLLMVLCAIVLPFTNYHRQITVVGFEEMVINASKEKNKD